MYDLKIDLKERRKKLKRGAIDIRMINVDTG